MSTTQRSEGMNAFFDGYVHSKTSLKQFVEQYERAMRCKVEKEFQADVRSFSQMVPCVSRLAIEKQFQEVYTIAKFKEFQEELTGKIYCSIVSTEEGPLGMRYEVREDIIIDERVKEKKFSIFVEKDSCDIVCNCHMFEFKGIICRHASTILIQNGVRSIPERYILWRWRRDVSRSYMRVKINYNGWISTPSQLRYDQLCSAFAKVADKVADDEERTRATMEWIQSQLNGLSISNANPSYGGNIYAQHSMQEQVRSCGEIATASSKQIMDPICSQRKGAPRKLRRKGPLETRTKKAKVGSSKSNKANAPSQNIVEDAQAFNQTFSQDAQYQALPPISHSQQLMTNAIMLVNYYSKIYRLAQQKIILKVQILMHQESIIAFLHSIGGRICTTIRSAIIWFNQSELANNEPVTFIKDKSCIIGHAFSALGRKEYALQNKLL
ncbi:protein FAR1-RELATED SEQUENCE 1-like [Diospyros lotus]|uniref:protein FAR1-RELATED SEQUENCE 1-like n=1 Tax=Diospyros lotus TaxID=55363 RepID=UPI00224DD32A|nr:protein FAR1-RELATED SEQUENCE 1-like [Diospyros lotus]